MEHGGSKKIFKKRFLRRGKRYIMALRFGANRQKMGCNLIDVDVAVGWLAVAVHPEGQQQSHGQHGDW